MGEFLHLRGLGSTDVTLTQDSDQACINDKVTKQLRAERIELEAARRVEMAHAYGADPYADGTIIEFDKVHNGKSYTYVATRAAGRWYLTSSKGNVKTWSELVEWLVKDEPVAVADIRVVRSGPASVPTA